MAKVLFLFIGACCASMPSSSSIAAPESQKVAEYEDVCCDDEKQRLEVLAMELRKDPEATAYVIYYGGRWYSSCWYDYPRHRPRLPYKGEAEARSAMAKPYLEHLGIEPERIVVLNGGYRQSWMMELWIAPKGAMPPTPTPTFRSDEIKFRERGPRDRALEHRCDEG
jgi:hypothetical protein